MQLNPNQNNLDGLYKVIEDFCKEFCSPYNRASCRSNNSRNICWIVANNEFSRKPVDALSKLIDIARSYNCILKVRVESLGYECGVYIVITPRGVTHVEIMLGYKPIGVKWVPNTISIRVDIDYINYLQILTEKAKKIVEMLLNVIPRL